MKNRLQRKNIMQKRFALALVSVGIFLNSGESQAADIEWIDQKEGAFEYTPGSEADEHHFNGLSVSKRIFAYYGSWVDANTGNGWHRVHITNGEKWGHHVCSETTYTGDGVSLSVRYRIGLDPGDEGYNVQEINMSPENWRRVKTYRIRAGYCPDTGLGEVFIEGVQALINVLASEDQGQTPMEAKPNTTSKPSFPQNYVWGTIPCRRPGSTGSLQIDATSPTSCEAAKSKIRAEAEQSCRTLYASDASLNGAVSFSTCGTIMVPQ
jgi:hypothetical protein